MSDAARESYVDGFMVPTADAHQLAAWGILTSEGNDGTFRVTEAGMRWLVETISAHIGEPPRPS